MEITPIHSAALSLGWTSLRTFDLYGKMPLPVLLAAGILIVSLASSLKSSPSLYGKTIHAINLLAVVSVLFGYPGFTSSHPVTRLVHVETEIANTIFAGFIALQTGFRLRQSASEQRGIFNLMRSWGTVYALKGIGSLGIYTGIKAISNLYHGMTRYYDSLDQEQQFFVTKYAAFESLLSGDPSCRAIVIDGNVKVPQNDPHFLSISTDHKLFNMIDPSIHTIYRNCMTQTYAGGAICDIMKRARKHFNHSVDLIYLSGHASPWNMNLGGREFNGSGIDIQCLDSVLSPEGQLVLAGCNTATTHTDHETPNSLTYKVANALPGRSITGFAAELNPFSSFSTFDKKKFSIKAFWPFDFYNRTTFFNSAKTIKIDISRNAGQ